MSEIEPGADPRREQQVAEEETIAESQLPTSPLPPESYADAGFFWKISADVEHIFLRELQRYFRENSLTQEFRWKEPLPDGQKNPESKVHIIETYAEQSERSYPAVIPVVIPANAVPGGFGDDVLTWNWTDEKGERHDYVRKSGMFDLTLTLQCMALNPLQCKKLADVVALGLVYPLKEPLRKREVELQPSSTISISAIRAEPLTAQATGNFYTIEVKQGVVTTWYQDFEVLGPELESLAVTTTKTGPPALDP